MCISGGSSSGFVVVVVRDLVAFVLGIDMVGFGRVLVGFNGLVGFKLIFGMSIVTGKQIGRAHV